MNRVRKKQAITLLEIMIVILLIGLIMGVIGYNMKGSLDKGKAFKSEQGAMRLKEILLLEAEMQGVGITDIEKTYSDLVTNSGLAKKKDDLLKDGWGKDYIVVYNKNEETIDVTSPGLQSYREKKQTSSGQASQKKPEEVSSPKEGT